MRSRIPALFAVLFALLAGSTALGAAADPEAGYKGIPWGANCSEAIQQMETKGFVFSHREKVGLRADARSPWQPHLFLRTGSGPVSCSMEDSDANLAAVQ